MTSGMAWIYYINSTPGRNVELKFWYILLQFSCKTVCTFLYILVLEYFTCKYSFQFLQSEKYMKRKILKAAFANSVLMCHNFPTASILSVRTISQEAFSLLSKWQRKKHAVHSSTLKQIQSIHICCVYLPIDNKLNLSGWVPWKDWSEIICYWHLTCPFIQNNTSKYSASQADTSCGASSQPVLIQNYFLIMRMLRFLRHSWKMP